ncbi:MAG: hypothetical protein PUB69_01130 [Desulfovibrionaceae bacterium]|nr:hypothetical protein [Desulfovibrionaceae bacterium]
MFQSMMFSGYSPWWLGIGVFCAAVLFALFGLVRAGRIVCAVSLVTDCVLLLVMTSTLPCLSCLVVALLLALSYAGFHAAKTGYGERKAKFSWLLVAWGLLFLLSLGGSVHALNAPWALVSAEGEDHGAVFFSPTCSACLKMLDSFPDAERKSFSFYPVAETERDFTLIHEMTILMQDNPDLSLTDALKQAGYASELSLGARSSFSALLLQFRLWKNRARVMSANGGILPFMSLNGFPGILVAPARDEKKAVTDHTDYFLPSELSIESRCSRSDGRSCKN